MKLSDVTHYPRQELEGASMKPPDQSYRYTPVDTTPNVAITSAIPVSNVVQRASRNGSHQSKRTRKNRGEESSRSPRQLTDLYKEALIRPYKCIILVAEDLRSGKALCDTTERSIIPIHVCIAMPNGVAPTSIGITSRSIIAMSTPTMY